MEHSGDLLVRVAAILVLIASAWTGAYAARHLSGGDAAARRKTGAANAMAGGFLLGAGLFHFLPDSHSNFETIKPLHDIPLAFVLAAAGFTAILAIERLSFDPRAHEMEDQGRVSTAPVLAIALSLHALLAGFAVGWDASAVTLLVLSAALAVHKFAAAFTLGSSLVHSGVSRAGFNRVILSFSIATPIGVALGSVSQTILESETGILIEAIFDGLVAGTFLYIAALEVIHQEFFQRRAYVLDLLLFVFGLLVMFLLALVV